MSVRPQGAALRATEISAGYGGRQVLHRVSLEVGFGELLAIVGPNGAGKSTILRLLAGSLEPWQGTIELLGKPRADFDRRDLARNVATVAQDNVVAFPFTVLEVVLMGRAPHLGLLSFESARDLAIADNALETLGLTPLKARYVQELSGGERKRVVLARALAQEPKVALLDEPTAFLDLKHVAEIFAILKRLCAERGLAVIATLHDLNAAALYADRVLLLKDGAAVACGPPEQVFTAESLRAVYETEIYVGRNPATGALMVLPATGVPRPAD
ncbi:MAG: heme ABC transporter ATP-binding protein [Candidatus Binataceae bacterium]